MDNQKYVASGAYGCVFAPAFPCGTPKTKSPRNTIGKLFDKKKNFDDEVQKMKLVADRIPDSHKFTFNITDQCEIKHFVKKNMPEGRKQCDKLSSHVWQIIYPHGGVDLENISKTIRTRSFYVRKRWFMNTVFKRLLNLLEGVQSMVNARLAHNDIKPGNILYNKNAAQKLKFIDFGLMREFETLFVPGQTFFDNVYLYFPPELYAYNRAYEDKRPTNPSVIKSEIIQYLKDLDLYFGSSYMRALIFIYGEQEVHDQVTNLTNTLLNFLPDFESWREKCDLYAIGVTVLRIMNNLRLITREDEELATVLDWASQLTHIDPDTRISVASAIKKYKAIMVRSPYRRTPDTVSAANMRSATVRSRSRRNYDDASVRTKTKSVTRKSKRTLPNSI